MTSQKHPLATWRFYTWTILSGGIGGTLLYFLTGWAHDYIYLSEPPQYPQQSVLFGAMENWPGIFRQNMPYDVIVVGFFVGLAMASLHLIPYYRSKRKEVRAMASALLLHVGMVGAMATLIVARYADAGWYAGIEWGLMAATVLIFIPAVVVWAIIRLMKVMPKMVKLVRRVKQSYGEYRAIRKKNQMV